MKEPYNREALRKKLRLLFTNASKQDIEIFMDVLEEYGELFKINKTVHLNFFLAQVREETGNNLKPKRENLNYSCSALQKIFRFYRNNPGLAQKDGRCDGHIANQKNIANNVYNHRLGNTKSYHGYKYRGGGYIQLTGKSNYLSALRTINSLTREDLDIDEFMSKIGTVKYALLSAMAFWYKKKLYTQKNIDAVTKKVNKYTDSYARRKAHYKLIANV